MMEYRDSNPHGGDGQATLRALGLEAGDLPPLRLDFSASLNPLGMPPAVEALLRSPALPWDRSPEPYGETAAAALAAAHGCEARRIAVGNGSTELFRLALSVLRPARAGWYEPCYGGYAEACRAAGIEGIPLGRGWREEGGASPAEALVPGKGGEKVDLVFLASPNNPTGHLLETEAVRALARSHPSTWFLLDESFHDFLPAGEAPSAIGPHSPPNLLVIKSLAKFFALPGLRLGMAFGPADVVERLRRGMLPRSLNAAALAVAPLLYRDPAYTSRTRSRVADWRSALEEELAALPGMRVFPSRANFLYARLPGGTSSRDLQAALLKQGILIRAYPGSFFRLAIRPPGEAAALMVPLRDWLGTSEARPSAAGPRRTPALMVLGTMSHAGKTALAAAFCRLLSRRGWKTAPFKAQNMALNSCVTPEGGEIGRAQALQARAAGVEPHTDMNPVLLKPAGPGLMQVIVDGKAVGNRTAREYYADKASLRDLAFRAYDRLAARCEVVVLEGAGSPAEINLREEDFVNASMAAHAGARCVLVADIDRGGVFASILGTVQLLPAAHRRLLEGIVINKFRGDVSLLGPGVEEIERLTGVPVLGVLPHLGNLGLEEEDSLGLERDPAAAGGFLDVAVIRLPHISNYTDFQPLETEGAVRLRYVERPRDLGNPDLLILPGSKNVRLDAGFLRETGLARALEAAAGRQVPVLGICGGYQMLGRAIEDPHGVEEAEGLEGEAGTTPGLGLLPVVTRMERVKELARVEADNRGLPFLPAGAPLRGYEIRMGRTRVVESCPALALIRGRNGYPCREESGHRHPHLPVFGLYMHGLFDSADVRAGLVDWLCGRRGLDPAAAPSAREGADPPDPLDSLADAVEKHVDWNRLLASLDLVRSGS